MASLFGDFIKVATPKEL